jgi:hypothetical protein
MPVETIHTYLVHPRTHDGAAPAGGAAVPLTGKLYELLRDVYEKSNHECDIDISFNHRPDGTQQNPCRDLLLGYLNSPTLEAGRTVAARLGEVTTHRSGLGLLFLLSGREGAAHKVVISRFPTDSAILAEENAEALSVAFLERVFMKSAFSYKAVAYQDTSLANGFWEGRAIDKQIGNPLVQVSTYWIKGFLDSDFRTTSAAGTRRLAESLRNAARGADSIQVKQEIAAVATLANSLQGQATSIQAFQDRFGLSSEARDVMNRHIRNPAVLTEQFVFDGDEFSRQIAYRSVELDSGAILTAQASDFDEVFEQEPSDADGVVRFSTAGRVVGENLRKVR